MSTSTPLRHSLPLPGGRRAFLMLAAAGLCRPSLSWSAGESDIALAQAVINLAMERESLSDNIAPFRSGVSGRIQDAMSQYLQVVDEHAGAGLARLQALRWALRTYTSPARQPSYGQYVGNAQLSGSITGFGSGAPKCNKLVADAYAHGAGLGLSEGPTWGEAGSGYGWPAKRYESSLWGPVSNHLSNPQMNLRSLTLARVLRTPGEPKASPELGDIIAFPTPGGTGHVGLYLGKNLIVSAKEGGVEIETIESEMEAHNGQVYIRKFNGSGQ